MILRWIAIGSLFLMVNALVIILTNDDEGYKPTMGVGLPEGELIINSKSRLL